MDAARAALAAADESRLALVVALAGSGTPDGPAGLTGRQEFRPLPLGVRLEPTVSHAADAFHERWNFLCSADRFDAPGTAEGSYWLRRTTREGDLYYRLDRAGVGAALAGVL